MAYISLSLILYCLLPPQIYYIYIDQKFAESITRVIHFDKANVYLETATNHLKHPTCDFRHHS